MTWAVDAVTDYVDIVLLLTRDRDTAAVWLSERNTRQSARSLNDKFVQLREELRLGQELTLHCLRHSYATHAIEDGHDPVFVQRQLGHAYRSTMGIYTHVSEELANRMLKDALARIPHLTELERETTT